MIANYRRGPEFDCNTEKKGLTVLEEIFADGKRSRKEKDML